MSFIKTDDISVRLTSIFMKLVGLWMATERSEQRIRDITVGYTLVAIIFAMWLQTTDMYYSWGDFSACLFAACNILSLTMPFIKILVLLAHKEDFFRLIFYLQRKFLHGNYNDYERKIVISCKRKCTFFICFFTLFTLATVASYIINPLVANIGRNESDRVLPFNMWIDLPLTVTPYYEIIFVLQVLSLYHIGISYFCFDNFLCIMNLHVAGQFRVLQYRIANMPDLMDKVKQSGDKILNTGSSCLANECYSIFKKYIRQHQALIAYCGKLEEVFSLIILEQVLMFSLLICLDGYQVLMADASTSIRVIFICHILACLCQLLMFTYSCDCIIRESASIATAAYKGPWLVLPMSTSGRMMRKDLTLIILRSHIPCCLTGKGFFVVSLETYTSVLSTAASYFTLLRQRETP
ncbi:odorant receptor 13a-like [Bombus affinis]|uniref:odorant receptor 13a-like n=1 Tax=Bombus affinis TaxID=309941 RepID=UPI00021A817A|nr:odorant receptor 13a-like [Bombus affinis]